MHGKSIGIGVPIVYMNSVDTIKNFLTQMLQGYFTELVELIGKPDVADIATVDCFTADSNSNGAKNGMFEKLGMDRKSTRTSAKISDLRGEVVKEADKGKIYEKLMKDGHVGDTNVAEQELQTIFIDLEISQPQNRLTTTSHRPVATPIQAALGELNETFPPFLDDEPERDGQGAESQDEEHEDETEEDESDETNLTLQAKSNYQKMNTFA